MLKEIQASSKINRMITGSTEVNNQQKSNFYLMILVGLSIILAISLRLSFLNDLQKYPFYDHLLLDSKYYDDWAADIMKGDYLRKGGEANPLYPVFLALVYQTCGRDYFTPRFIQCLIDSVTGLLIYLCARSHFSKFTSILSAYIYAFYLPAIYFCGSYLATTLIPFFSLLSLFFLQKASQKSSVWLVFFAGCFIGLAISGRPNLLIILPLILPWFLMDWHRSLASRIGRYALYCTGSMFILFPTILLNRVHSGDTIQITHHGGINFYIGNNAGASGIFQALPGMSDAHGQITVDSIRMAEAMTGKKLTAAEASGFWYNQAIQEIISHPSGYLRLIAKKFALFWNGEEIPANESLYFDQLFIPFLRYPLINFYFISPLALLGLAISIPKYKNLLILIVFILATKLSLLAFFISDRYRFPVIPIFIMFAAHSVTSLFRAGLQKKYFQITAMTLSLAAFTWFANLQLYDRNFLPGYYNLAKIYFSQNRLNDAEQICRFILKQSDSAKTHNFLGSILLRQNRLESAALEFESAIQMDPLLSEAYSNLAFARFNLNQITEAIRMYRRSIEINPYSFEPYYNLGLIYLTLNDMNNAEWCFLEVLQRDTPADIVEQVKPHLSKIQSLKING